MFQELSSLYSVNQKKKKKDNFLFSGMTKCDWFPYFLLLLYLNLQNPLPLLSKGARLTIHCIVSPAYCPGKPKSPHFTAKSPNPLFQLMEVYVTWKQHYIHQLCLGIPPDVALSHFITNHCNEMQSKGNLTLFSFQFLGGQEGLGLLWTTKETVLTDHFLPYSFFRTTVLLLPFLLHGMYILSGVNKRSVPVQYILQLSTTFRNWTGKEITLNISIWQYFSKKSD